MPKLFIDTHSEMVTIAIAKDDEVQKIEKKSERSHSEVVVPSLDEILKKSEIELSDLDEIIVVNGPGSFTGVRIGVTIAKTIAYSLSIPIKTITSLEMYGVSADEDFDLVTIEDSKGVYSAHKINGEYVEYMYLRRSEFEEYVQKNRFTILPKRQIDIPKIIEYAKIKEFTNPHKVNPIYIKEIDALK